MLYPSISCQIFCGPCTINVQGQNVLEYKGATEGTAGRSHIFTIPGIDTVMIYDFRTKTAAAMSASPRNRDYSRRVIQAFEQPGMVTASQVGGIYFIEIQSAGSWLAKAALKRLSKHTIRIATGPKDSQLHHQLDDSIVFESNQTGQNSNAMFGLYNR